MQPCSALYLGCPIIPTLTSGHGPDNSSHSTATRTASSQMDSMKIYCHYKSICSASPRSSICIKTFGGGWRGLKRSRCLWSALQTFLPSPNGPSIKVSASSLPATPSPLCCHGYTLLFLYYCSVKTSVIHEIWCREKLILCGEIQCGAWTIRRWIGWSINNQFVLSINHVTQ